MDGLKDYLESKLREHEKSMKIYEDVLERATSSLCKGFVGSTMDTATGYHMVKASYETVREILEYMEVEEKEK